jgi:hypothetical protein
VEQILAGKNFRCDLWVDGGLPVRYYQCAQTVERLRVSGEMVQVRFDSLHLHDAGMLDVGRSEIGRFRALDTDVGPCACSEVLSGGSRQEEAWAEWIAGPEEWMQRTLQKETKHTKQKTQRRRSPPSKRGHQEKCGVTRAVLRRMDCGTKAGWRHGARDFDEAVRERCRPRRIGSNAMDGSSGSRTKAVR